MELELGLKFTRMADEFTSDLQIAKDRAGPLFLSRETDPMFILTAHLKGYRRRNIKIDINEDGSLIAISGERQVKETLMVGWKVVKKDTETKGFKKVFKIPNGVILDKIKAKFNEDESTLTITMPKKNRGICSTSIEEVKEKQELVKEGSSGSLQIVDEKSLNNTGTSGLEKDEESDARNREEIEQVENTSPVSEHSNRGDDHLENGEKVENQEPVDDIQERLAPEQNLCENENRTDDGSKDVDEEEEKVEEEIQGEEREAEPGNRGKRCKMCIPIVAVGSTLLVSLLVFVFQIVRSKNQTNRRRG